MRSTVWVASIIYLPADNPVWKYYMCFSTLKEARAWLKSDYPLDGRRRRIPCKKRIERFERARP